MARLDQWSEERRHSLIFFGNDEEFQNLTQERAKSRKGKDHGFEWTLIASSREIIFELRDGEPVFNFVLIGIDSQTLELVTAAAIEGTGHDDDDVKKTLALAVAEHIPVYPNTPEDAPRLLSYQKDLMAEGFSVGKEENGRRRYILTRYEESARTPEEALERLASEEFLSPVEAEIVRNALAERLEEHELAGRALARLRSGVDELESLLSADVREADLQECLTRNPALFGAEYREIRPKHRLGAEFEMDYALVRVSGTVDLVEIERSSHRLFKQNGDPTAALIHAEQQVLDWLDWVDQNIAYARQQSPLLRPTGFVIIGRAHDLPADGRERLTRRNIAFEGALQVLTYDDLLSRARHLVDLLVEDPVL
jgi:Domain of unknown function (DUF4263)